MPYRSREKLTTLVADLTTMQLLIYYLMPKGKWTVSSPPNPPHCLRHVSFLVSTTSLAARHHAQHILTLPASWRHMHPYRTASKVAAGNLLCVYIRDLVVLLNEVRSLPIFTMQVYSHLGFFFLMQ